MKLKQFLIGSILFHALISVGSADSSRPGEANASAIVLSGLPPKVHNRRIAVFTENNRTGLRLNEQEGNGLGWWPDLVFTNGTIEFDVRGRDLFQKSFVGVAFHGLDENTYDAVYFRPFNFKATDPLRRAHGVQYIAQPGYTWDRLRTEHPNQYEGEVSPAPDPNEWFNVRIVVDHPRVRVFINHQDKPCFQAEQLSHRQSGWIGLWVGNGSDGDFSNLKVTRALTPNPSP
jgi:hypothetical protein